MPLATESIARLAGGESYDVMRLGTRIETSRNNRGLSQAALAQKIGLGYAQQSRVSRWERGVGEPSGEQLVALADALGVSLDYLLRGVERDLPPELPSDELQILDLYRALKLSKEDALRGLALAARSAASGAWEGLTGAGRVVSVRDTTEHHDRLDRERLDRERKAAREESLRRAAPKRLEETRKGEEG